MDDSNTVDDGLIDEGCCRGDLKTKRVRSVGPTNSEIGPYNHLMIAGDNHLQPISGSASCKFKVSTERYQHIAKYSSEVGLPGKI